MYQWNTQWNTDQASIRVTRLFLLIILPVAEVVLPVPSLRFAAA